ncbi:Spindle assembly abnormal protein 6 [Sparganum proliferum]
MINDISKQLEDVSLTKETDIAALKKNHAAEVEQLKESHESMLVSVQNKFTLELKAAEEATEAMKTAMQTTINSQHSELEELNGRVLALNSKVSVLNSSISEKEATLATLRKENDDEVTSERNRKEHLDANNLKLNQKICDLETDLVAERKKNSLIDAELIHQREKVRVTLEDSQRKGKHLEKTEKLLKQQTAEIAKANSIIKQLQRELKNSQTKAKLRGQVATEQEKVLTSKELELEDLQQKIEQLKTQVSAEKRQREEGQAKLLQVESALEEAQKTIKSNENIINWLNRQISESYSTSLHNRLKSSGIPVPGANDGFFDLSKPKVPFDGGANGVPALKPTFTGAPFPPLSDSQRKGKHLEKTEKLLKQQTAEIAKANSIIKQLQRELKNSQTKAKLRGQVATEQEKVLTSKELELEDLQQKIEQLKTQVSAEKRQREEGQAKLLQVESALEEAQKTIKSNENIINWLNRQISESYSTSLHNRLKSSGIPVPGANDGFFDLSKPKVPFDGGANGVPALKPTFTGAPFPPLSVTSLTALTSTAGESLLSTGKGQTTTCRSPSVPPCSSGSAAPQTNAGLVLVAAGESSLSRPPVLLSTADKSQVSVAHTTTSPREFSTTAPDARKPSSRPSQGATSDFKFVSSYPLPPKPRTLGYGDLPGFDRRAASGLQSQSVSCDEKQHQSLTSSFFPQTNTAR